MYGRCPTNGWTIVQKRMSKVLGLGRSRDLQAPAIDGADRGIVTTHRPSMTVPACSAGSRHDTHGYLCSIAVVNRRVGLAQHLLGKHRGRNCVSPDLCGHAPILTFIRYLYRTWLVERSSRASRAAQWSAIVMLPSQTQPPIRPGHLKIRRMQALWPCIENLQE